MDPSNDSQVLSQTATPERLPTMVDEQLLPSLSTAGSQAPHGESMISLASPRDPISECVEQFATQLTDTEWRRASRESYARLRGIREQVKNLEETLLRSASQREGAETNDTQEIAQRIRDYKESLLDSWRRECMPFEAGGVKVVDGRPLQQSLGLMWTMMDSASYCFMCLRREKLPDLSRAGAINLMLERGYVPVREPQDFDVVVYGEVLKDSQGRDFKARHFGMWRDGLVVSKDTRSLDVYHHPLEQCAADATHVIFFRHPTCQDPHDIPNSEELGSLRLVEDGVGVWLEKHTANAQVSTRRSIVSVLSTWIRGMWESAIRRGGT